MTDNNYSKIQNISLKKIKPNPRQPRKYFNPDSMDALTRSIERYGVLNPITVREAEDGLFELISGERRYRAAFSAGLTYIPCIVISSSDNDCAILSLLENLHREDLSFLEIAESYRELVKKRGVSSRDISRKLGGLPFEIKERINLMKLDPLVRKYIRNFNLNERQAKALLKIRDKQMQLDAVRNICENRLNEEDTIRFINDIINGECQPDIHINKMKNTRLLKNTLSNAVNIIKQSGISADYKENVYDWGEEFIIIIKNPVP